MSVLALFLLLAALIVFLLRAFVVVTRVHLIALGLALFTGFVIALHFTSPTIGH